MMDEPAKKRRPGPKPRGPFENKRRTLTTKITESTRRSLEEAAAGTDRSLSQEIEFRLERSLDQDRQKLQVFGSERNYRLLALLGMTIMIVEEKTGGLWTKDPRTFAEVQDVVGGFFEKFRPEAATGIGGVFDTQIGKDVLEALSKPVLKINANKQ